MDQASRVAFIQAQTVCALAELEGMKAANASRERMGKMPLYGHAKFMSLEVKYQLGWNTVITYLNGDQ